MTDLIIRSAESLDERMQALHAAKAFEADYPGRSGRSEGVVFSRVGSRFVEVYRTPKSIVARWHTSHTKDPS